MIVRHLLLLIVLPALCLPAWSKTVRDYYSEARLGVMRQNVEQYDWARAELDRIIKEADKWAAYDDERLRELVPPPTVPRAARVSINECPVHGQEVLKVASMYGWKMDFDHPYKVICPVGGESYPSNDFNAYLKSGMKDRSLLTGEYVDDGWGYEKKAGDKFRHWFVAYYAHWMVRNWLHPALQNLSQAYLLTGDTKYAHKAALLLWQLAQYYPDYQYEKQSSYGKENDPSYLGRLLYHTWETWTVEIAALTYDAVFPYLAQDVELQKLAGTDGAGLQKQLEERLLRVMADDIIGGSHRIQGNYGMHQKAALLVALALHDDTGKANSKQIVEWVLKNPAPAELYTDAPFEDMLTNLIHRDGVPFESPSYNCGWLSDLSEIADLLLANGVNYWDNPRFRSIFTSPVDQLVLGKITTPLGDSNNMFAGPLGVGPAYLQRAYAQFPDRQAAGRLAAAMVQSGGAFPRDLFQPYLGEKVKADAAALGKQVGTESSLLAGLGNLTLQTGSPGHETGLSLFYGQYIGHIHFDLLNVDFYAQGQPLTPDLGYPETADSYDPRRFGFLAHTVVHNTCMVNGRRQETGRGQLVAFHPGGFAQMAEVTGNAAYPEVVKDYRRTVMLVEATPEQAYYVDIFRVDGGRQHDWLVHGTEAEFTASVPFGAVRAEGTLAGADVPYGKFYDDEKLKESRYGLYYPAYRGSAFQWLRNVQEATLQPTEGAAPWVQWKMNRDPELFPKEYARGATLRSHLVSEGETVFACDGVPQRRPKFPEKLKWVVRRRTADNDNLQSAFVTVHEGFLGQEAIRSVKRLPVSPADAVAIEVDLGDRKHVIFSARNLRQEYVVGKDLRVKGRAAVVAYGASGGITTARLFDGEYLRQGGVEVRGNGLTECEIKDVSGKRITLTRGCLRAEDAGKWVSLRSAGHEAAVRLSRVVAPDCFETDDDLVTAGGTVLGVEGSSLRGNVQMYFAEPGMTIVNEAGKPVGRVQSNKGLSVEAEAPLSAAAFSDADGDGRVRFRVIAAGPGDRVLVGSSAIFGGR
ncbi:MAG: heparinase II/III family protein [Armatimonadia bacterium]